MRIITLLIVGLMVLPPRSSHAAGEQTANWLGGAGNYSDATKWSGGVVPSGPDYNVNIDNGLAVNSIVTLNSTPSIYSLSISAGDLLRSQYTLYAAAFANSGTLSTDNFYLNGGTIVTGNGTLLLPYHGGVNSAKPWTNGGNYIDGAGSISNLSGNAGTIFNATYCTITGASLLNSGTISGSGSTSYTALTFSSGVANTATGKIITNGGTILIDGGSVTLASDDNLQWTGGGVIACYGGLATAGRSITVPVGGVLGGSVINNNGNLTGNGALSYLSVVGNSGGRIVVNNASSTLRTVNNTGGTISLIANANLTGTLSGGTITSANGALLTVSGGTLANCTNNGTINFGFSASVNGTVGGYGTLNFGTYGVSFDPNATLTLSGSGTATLAGGTLSSYATGTYSTATLSNAAGHTLSGRGAIGTSYAPLFTSTIENYGLLRSSGGTLYLTGTDIYNGSGGTLRVATNSEMSIESSHVVGVGSIDVQSGATLSISSPIGTASLTNVYNAGTITIRESLALIGNLSGGTLSANTNEGLSIVDMNAISLTSTGTVLMGGRSGVTLAALKAQYYNAPTTDLNIRTLLVDYSGASPLASLTAKVKAAHDSPKGAWQGTANTIYSSAAAYFPAIYGIGVGEASTLFGTTPPATYLSQTIDATTAIVRFTYLGDANLDGKVDVSDLGALSTHWQQNGAWTDGDFNYDGKVDVLDLGALSSNWQRGTGGSVSFAEALASVGMGNANVPEPVVAALAPLLLVAARRRCFSLR